MAKKTTFKLFLLTLFLAISTITFAQKETKVSGVVRDAETGEPIAGATIIVKGKVVGSATLIDGDFNFGINLSPPFTLVFSAVGYEIREYEVSKDNEELIVNLRVVNEIERSNTIANRTEESILQSNSEVDKRGLTAIRQATGADFYTGLSTLKSAQITTSSVTFQSLNTRGFSSIGNTRLTQFIDGIDNSAPGLNFTLGNFAGISELDIAEVELVHGAASGLYGPNAFNGILVMSSKSPFDYQGLSAELQNGLSVQNDGGTNPYLRAGIRYAHLFNDKLALKVNLSAFKGTDWYAADYTDLNLSNEGLSGQGINPAFDGVNVYGDETNRTYDWDALFGTTPGTFGTSTIARTGYSESDLTNYNAQSYKGAVSLHYRLTETVEFNVGYNGTVGNTIFQGTNRYAFNNIQFHQLKTELKGENFFLRAYNNRENSGDSYNMAFLGRNLNQAWKTDDVWYEDYKNAYMGTISGIDTLDHQAARLFADRNRLKPGTAEYDEAVQTITEDSDLTTGARFLDKTSLFHIETMYDFTNDLNRVVELKVGGNYRKFKVNSEGSLFNDLDNPITIGEYGAYMQVGKSLLPGNRLKLSASARYDKNQNFDGQLTPRASVVYSTGEEKAHNFRASFQTGFRNPEIQAQYIGLDLGFAKLLGGVQDNVNSYSVEVPYLDALGEAQLANVTGLDVYNNSYTLASVLAFQDSGDPTMLEQSVVNYVKPERIVTYEVGYRGIINKTFFLDLTYFRSTYIDFLGTTNVIVPLTGSVEDATGIEDLANGTTTVFQLYSNADGEVTAQGISAGFEYALRRGFKISGNYTYSTFDLGTTDETFVPGFNAPKNQYTLGFSNRNVYKGFGFNVNHRWSDEFYWKSAFGSGQLPAYNTTNVQITYEIPQSHVRLKVGGTNIFQNEYRTAYGAPLVGAQYFIGMTYNEFL